MVSAETILFITNSYNVIILFLIPFTFGTLAAITRVLLSGTSMLRCIKLIIASGAMAGFSWIGIKSKLFMSLVAPYVELKTNGGTITDLNITEFYSMVFVAILVGMFASNLFFFIEDKMKMLSLKSEVKALSKDKEQMQATN